MIRDYFKAERQHLKVHFKTMMRLSSILLILHSLCVTVNVAAQGVSMAKPGCKEKCGNITVPFPFGIGGNCSAGPNFTAVCNGTSNRKKLYLSALDLEAEVILLRQQTVRVLYPISQMNCSDVQQEKQLVKLEDRYPYKLSSIYSRFVVIGCNSVVSMIPSYGACNPVCLGNAKGCNGINCCTATIPPGLKELNISYHTVDKACRNVLNSTNVGGDCGYAFLTDDRWVKAQADRNFSDTSEPLKKEVSLVLHWEFDTSQVQKYKWVTCNASRSDNTTTECFCQQGFEGNPYLPGGGGCQDINECKDGKLNTCRGDSKCVNKEGSFTCQEPISAKLGVAAAGSGVGALLLIVGTWMSAKTVRRRREENRKTSLFNRNGGSLLKKLLPANDSGGKKFIIFNSEELSKATIDYSENQKLGSGGQATVYQGVFDKKWVAVKKLADESKKVNEAHIEDYITEIATISQIDHKNIVKLVGCCLETEVPILVYEFIPKGTLFNYIHVDKHEFPWESRIKMTTEVAEAIAKLHGAEPIPIYHRDVKLANILLDDAYQAKVSDFGMPWPVVSIDQQNDQATRLLLSQGYEDPSYILSRQYTDKSDVFSFGVVMVELLTGEKADSEVKYEGGKKVLRQRFLDAMERDNLFDIIDQKVKNGPEEEIMAFAELARRCLDLDEKKRPTMKEATEELVRIKNPKESSRTQSKLEGTEIEPTEVSDVSDYPSTSTTPNLNVFTGEL